MEDVILVELFPPEYPNTMPESVADACLVEGQVNLPYSTAQVVAQVKETRMKRKDCCGIGISANVDPSKRFFISPE